MWLLLALGCGSGGPPVVPDSWTLQEVPDTRGLSGLGRDRQGTLWAVGERDQTLRTLDGSRSLPIRDIPEGHDTESLAWISTDRVAFGTESMDVTRTTERILVGEVSDTEVRIVDTWEVPLATLGVPARPNRGLEGICATRVGFVAATETVVEADGARWAGLVWRPLGGGTWTRGRLKLSTDTGKISALHCAGDKIWAIERHYGIAVLLEFSLTGATITPTVTPLHPQITGTLPNLEGLDIHEGVVTLLSDNDSGGVSGPSYLVNLPL